MNGFSSWFRNLGAKIAAGIRHFMMGRYGTDKLNMVILGSGLIASLVSMFIHFAPVNLLLTAVSYALMGWAIFRTFSRNIEKRRAENAKYVDFIRNFKSKTSQFFTRLKNAKKYKYFHCPECKALLRLPRKVGEVTVTCGKCQHQFKKKA